MSDGLPVLTGKVAVRALERAGFFVSRVSGSHHVLIKAEPERTTIVVPVHGSRELTSGTLRAIIRQANMSVAEFCEYL